MNHTHINTCGRGICTCKGYRKMECENKSLSTTLPQCIYLYYGLTMQILYKIIQFVLIVLMQLFTERSIKQLLSLKELKWWQWVRILLCFKYIWSQYCRNYQGPGYTKGLHNTSLVHLMVQAEMLVMSPYAWK